MSDFKGLVEEMKTFYGVSSLEAVAEKMGYEKNTAIGWRNNKKLSAHAQLKWLEAKSGGNNDMRFEQLVEEMKDFYGVGSLDAIAEKLGYERTNAAVWRKNKKFSARALIKWLEVKQNQKTGEETMSTTRNVRILNAGETLSFAPLLSFYGCQTLKELAQKMGFAPQNADKWALDDNVPQYVLLKFEIDKRCANGQPIGDAIQAVMQAKTICVRYFPELSISAGYGIATTDSVGIQVELQQILLDGLGICNKEFLDILTVCGDSMLPILQDGDRVLVERNCAARNGDCVVAVIENELVVKELERHPLGHWVRLHSKNEKYRDIELEGQEVEKMRIVGIVRAIIRTMGRKV